MWLELFDEYAVPLRWADIQFGFERGLLSVEEVGDFAVGMVKESSSSGCGPAAIELCWPDLDAQEVSLLVSQLAATEAAAVPAPIDKWEYVMARKALGEDLGPREALVRVDCVWAELGMPSDMVSLIYYMPPDDERLVRSRTVEQNRRALLDRARRFLAEKRLLIDFPRRA